VSPAQPATEAPVKSILIAGIGNIFLGDDAFGVEVAQRLARRTWPENVRAVDFGIRGIDLAFALLDGVDLTILIDASPRGQAPGTLYLIEPETEHISADMDAHSMNPMAVPRLVKTMGGEFRRILIVGCEPFDYAERMGLSAPVEAAIEGASAMVRELVDNELSLTGENI